MKKRLLSVLSIAAVTTVLGLSSVAGAHGCSHHSHWSGGHYHRLLFISGTQSNGNGTQDWHHWDNGTSCSTNHCTHNWG